MKNIVGCLIIVALAACGVQQNAADAERYISRDKITEWIDTETGRVVPPPTEGRMLTYRSGNRCRESVAMWAKGKRVNFPLGTKGYIGPLIDCNLNYKGLACWEALKRARELLKDNSLNAHNTNCYYVR